jgi:hypothetical protein
MPDTGVEVRTFGLRVVQQVLPPGVKHGEKADARARMLGVAGDGEQRFGGGAEQNVVNHLFVVKSFFSDLRGHCKDDVKVFDRQQFGLSAFEPLGALRALVFGAMAVPASNGDLSITCIMEIGPFGG